MKNTTLILLSLLIASCQKESKTHKQIGAIMSTKDTTISNTVLQTAVTKDTVIKGVEIITFIGGFVDSIIPISKGQWKVISYFNGKSIPGILKQIPIDAYTNNIAYTSMSGAEYFSFKVNGRMQIADLHYVTSPVEQFLTPTQRFSYSACLHSIVNQCGQHWTCTLMCLLEVSGAGCFLGWSYWCAALAIHNA